MNSKFIFIIVAVLLIFSTHPVDTNAQVANFSMKILYPVDDILYDNIAQGLSQFWAPLYVDVKPEGLPLPAFMSRLIDERDEWDAFIYSYDTILPTYPIIYDIYHPDSFIASDMYEISTTSLKVSENSSLEDLSLILENYESALTRSDKIDFAKEFQKEYNDNWLLDIPLISQGVIVGAWKGFTGLDMDEDLIHSLFLGAEWSEIPEERIDERTESEIHYPLSESHKIPVPIYATSRSDSLLAQSLYSSLMTVDKYGLVHPNLAKSYIHELIDGASVWTFHLRDDILWSDGESLTASDVKFTLDMNTFPWIASANADRWRNLERVEMINETSIKIIFDHQTLEEVEILSNEFIIPNHILNTTFTTECGDTSTPYSGGNPGNSPEWSSYIGDPVTAGPYAMVDFEDSLVLTLEQNQNYWYPSEVDFDHSFNLDNPDKEDPYYFVFEDNLNTVEIEKVDSLPISKIVFHVADAATIDSNTAALLFETGGRDFHEYPKLDSNSNVFSNEKLSIYSKGVAGSGLQLIINPRFEALSEYEIRKALSLAIDRPVLEEFVGFAQFAQATPISTYYTDFYDTSAATPYDYELAKDLFRKHGLTALDTNVPVDYTPPSPWDEIPISFISVLIAVPVIGFTYRTRKNKF